MISETARYHGSFFVLLIEALSVPVTLTQLRDYGAGFYLLGGSVPLYVKHSTKRHGPWTFNFYQVHQELQDELFREYGECITCLVCGRDGVAGLRMKEMRQVLDHSFEEQECISVKRRLKTMYQVKGRDGALDKKVSRNSVFEKISIACENNRE